MKGKRCDLLSAQLLQKVVEDSLEPIEDPKRVRTEDEGWPKRLCQRDEWTEASA